MIRSSWLAVLIAALLTGCDCPQQQQESPAERAGIDEGLSAAARFLAAKQATDGAWRSDVYAPFKEGDALTPLVLMALLEAPHDRQNRPVIDKAARYLAAMVREDGTIEPPRDHLAYPVYTAAAAVIGLSRQSGAPFRAARDAWLRYLVDRQLAEPLGWQPGDPFYGGWGYAGDLPQKPSPGQAMAPLAEPNLSATVFALEALRAAGVEAGAAAVQKSLAFVCRCQNFTSDSAAPVATWDDGGFFFIQNDPVRNKAGVAGTDRSGRVRYASYGSATADGLRALMMCGLPSDDPRVAAAWGWLEKHFSAATHPGGYVSQREAAREAVYFYYCHTLATALFEAECDEPSAGVNLVRWARAIADELLKRQRKDGSWTNAAVDVREDDPLVATSLATRALAMCRLIILAGSSPAGAQNAAVSQAPRR